MPSLLPRFPASVPPCSPPLVKTGMLDRQFVRANSDLVKQGAKKKNMDAPVDEFLKADAAFRALTHQLGEGRAKLNAVSKSIGALMAQGKKDEAEAAKAEAKVLSDAIAEG